MEGSMNNSVEIGITNAMIMQALNSVRKDSQWHGRWIAAADWCELLRRSAPSVLASMDTNKLNKAIADSSLKHGFEEWETNPIGFLRRYHKVGGSPWCYFASVPGSTVSDSIDGSPWLLEVRPTTREEFEQVVPVVVTLPVNTAGSTSAKRPRPASSQSFQPSVAKGIHQETAWDSSEARKIFAPREDEVATHVLDVIQNRLTFLSTALSSATGYKMLVEGHDPDDLFSAKDVFEIRLKAQYLHAALHFASKEWKYGSVTWMNCCEKAIAYMAVTGVVFCKGANTMVSWHKHLRMNNTVPHHFRPPSVRTQKARAKKKSDQATVDID
jgi:hypothetical protein